jgi:hypothetical protein
MSAASEQGLIGEEARQRLMQALNAGSPHLLACEYAGIPVEVYREQRRRDPAFALEADRVRATGQVSCLMFIQAITAEDWKVAVEFLRLTRPELFGTGRARDGGRGYDRPEPADGEVSADDVAAVIRVLQISGLGSPEDDLDAAQGDPESLRPASANGQADGLPGGQRA